MAKRIDDAFIDQLVEKQREGSFCPYAFGNIRNSMQSGYAPCCWFNPNRFENPTNTLPFEYYDNDHAVRVRSNMLNNEKSLLMHRSCKICLKWEREGAESPRLMAPVDRNVLKNFDVEGAYIGPPPAGELELVDPRDYGRHIQLELNIYGNACNLECYGCKPFDSTVRKKRVDELEAKNPEFKEFLWNVEYPSNNLKQIDKDQFDAVVNDVIKNIGRVKSIMLCGGEPMLMKSHFILLDRIIESGHSKEIELTYVSNMTVFHMKQMKKYLDAFRWTSVHWSCDGMDERNHYLRYPTHWDTVLEHVNDVQDYFAANGNGFIDATYTPSLFSIYKIKEVFQFFEECGLKKRPFQVYNKIEDPKFLKPNHLPDEIKKEIADDVRSVSESVYVDMLRPRDEKMFRLALKYMDELDESRGTNWRAVFPELAGY